MALPLLYLTDIFLGGTWQVGVDNTGTLNVTSVATKPTPPIYLADFLTSAVWVLTLNNGLLLSSTGPVGYKWGSSYGLQAPNGNVWTLMQFGQNLATFIAPGPLPPKIVYPSGGGGVLPFTRFPREQPIYWYESTWTVNEDTPGQTEICWLHTSSFYEGLMEWVEQGTDITNWYNFMLYALTGGSFDYYPSQSTDLFTTYWLEDTEWRPELLSTSYYRFPLHFRQVIATT